MLIEHDYSYLNLYNSKELIEKDYADLDIHSIHFSRYFTEEEKEHNKQLADTLSNEEWSKYCEDTKKETYHNLLFIIKTLNKKYDIHQFDKDKCTLEHYKSNWDLHFYSNAGWNGKDYFDYVQLTFNDNRTVNQNMKLLNDILALFKQIDNKQIQCRVQYTARKNKEKIENEANNIYNKLAGMFVTYDGMEGKIKVVDEYNGVKKYGFFKKRARNKYYPISKEYLILKYA